MSFFKRASRTAIVLSIVATLTSAFIPTGAVAQGNPAAGWKTWHLTGPDQFRLGPPPTADSRKTRRELRELLRLQEDRTRSQKRAIKRWHGQPAILPWTRVQLRRFAKNEDARPPVAARSLAILHTGLFDAMVAALDSRDAHSSAARPAPAKLEPRLNPVLRSPTQTYAPVPAAMAGAAEVLLPYLNPAARPGTFEKLADQATESRLWAGIAYRSDVERARKLGQRVAQVVIDHVSTDNSNAAGFSEPRPAPGEARAIPSDNGDPEKQWQPTPRREEPPTGGPVGMWRPWVLSSPGEMTPVLPGPYTYGSPEFMAELHEVIDVQENVSQDDAQNAHFWNDGPGTFTPAGHWADIATDLIKDYKLDTKEATRALALLGVTEADAVIAAFHAKYHWWSIRPISSIWRLCYDTGEERLCTDEEAEALHAQDPALAPYWDTWDPLIETPPFPSYPGGHGTFSGAAGRILSFLIPEAGETLNMLAESAAHSRLSGGIHFHSDNRDALVLGRAVADKTIEYAQNDGSGL